MDYAANQGDEVIFLFQSWPIDEPVFPSSSCFLLGQWLFGQHRPKRAVVGAAVARSVGTLLGKRRVACSRPCMESGQISNSNY